jgi:hypothetical protein
LKLRKLFLSEKILGGVKRIVGSQNEFGLRKHRNLGLLNYILIPKIK